MQVREGTNPDSCLKGSLMAVVPKDLEEPSLSQTGIGKVLAKEQSRRVWLALVIISSTQLAHQRHAQGR